MEQKLAKTGRALFSIYLRPHGKIQLICPLSPKKNKKKNPKVVTYPLYHSLFHYWSLIVNFSSLNLPQIDRENAKGSDSQDNKKAPDNLIILSSGNRLWESLLVIQFPWKVVSLDNNYEVPLKVIKLYHWENDQNTAKRPIFGRFSNKVQCSQLEMQLAASEGKRALVFPPDWLQTTQLSVFAHLWHFFRSFFDDYFTWLLYGGS